MAKIRGVKPEFWTDEAVVELSRDARLLFIGMWNFACDNGHLDDKPKQLKMRIFPADDDTDMEAWLEELVAAGRITRIAGTITIPRFSDHQKPHKRWWSTCDLPECTHPDKSSEDTDNGGGGHSTGSHNRGATVSQPLSPGGPTADGEGDGEGDGDGEGGRRPSGRRKPSHPLPSQWQPTAKHAEYATAHNIDLPQQAMRFRNDALAKDKRYADWDAAFRNWLTKALEFGQTRAGGATRPEPRRIPRQKCPTCNAPQEVTHYDDCPDQKWRPTA